MLWIPRHSRNFVEKKIEKTTKCKASCFSNKTELLHRKLNCKNMIKIVSNVENNTSCTYSDFFCPSNLKKRNKRLMHLIFTKNCLAGLPTLQWQCLRKCCIANHYMFNNESKWCLKIIFTKADTHQLTLTSKSNCKYCSMFNIFYSLSSILTLNRYVYVHPFTSNTLKWEKKDYFKSFPGNLTSNLLIICKRTGIDKPFYLIIL